MLRQMRRSTLWFVIAAFWLVDALFAAWRHHAGQAGLTLAIAMLFGAVGVIYRKREMR